ncbi:hypothetical protein C9374_007282 [Naegleria lovaniensis]|uniref:Myosin n=1 Tax=Naegleria lovaniensis TaxID=51637 RepID=A0AA88H4U0_NAELO|nr:uncharacterized protein C9374_007282 [Naegleria lovaniensis]KAG2393751.1 hypothetical protein C9374_007282 [Naegleria lovaniensis]
MLTTPRGAGSGSPNLSNNAPSSSSQQQQQPPSSTPQEDSEVVVVQSVNPNELDSANETSEFALYQLYKRNFESDTIDDLSLLKEPTDQTVTRILRNRFYNQQPDINGGTSQFYTYLGPTIIAVNPYQKTKHYKNHVKTFYHAKQPYEIGPHLYSLAEDAYRQMKETGQGQTVIVSGESGAGKTESCKILLEYISAISISGLITENIKRILIEANPVLEAFGNAKTLRNDNSSRFGKYMEIFFNFKGQLEGAHITTSLLEKSRVVTHRKGERNFHIFYQMCAGADESMKKDLKLDDAKKFNYLTANGLNASNQALTISGVNDKLEFKNTRQSMTEAGISVLEQMEIFRLCAGILHLGNVKFKEVNNNGKETAEIENKDTLRTAAYLFQIDYDVLRDAILYRTIHVGREATKTLQNAEKSAYNRDALAKGIYERLFAWLIRRINSAVKRPDDAKYSIGILDIYGFEIYEKYTKEKNSLEQLNINYVNEKIQQQVQKWLQSEQDEYVREGIPYTPIPLKNVDQTVEVIEGRPLGIYKLLDEESLFPNGTDERYMQKLNTAFGTGYACYEKSKFAGLIFDLKHFAGKVTYDVEGWVTMNKDTLFEDLVLAMRRSQSNLMQQLFPRDEKVDSFGKLQKTTTMQFAEDVLKFVGKMKGKHHHFVKCIKPNHEKKPNEFLDEVVMEQVKYLGITENVHIRNSGYYFKMDFDKFLDRYKMCSDATWPRWNGSPKAGVKKILQEMKIPKSKYALGQSKVFLQTPVQLFALDEKIASRRIEMASIIQRNFRKYKARQKVLAEQHLQKALEKTFGEKCDNLFQRLVNQINWKTGERQRKLLVVAPSAIYLVDPKTYTVLKRVQYKTIDSLKCSALNDEVIIISAPQVHDLMIEADSKNEVMKAIRDSYDLFFSHINRDNSAPSNNSNSSQDTAANSSSTPRKDVPTDPNAPPSTATDPASSNDDLSKNVAALATDDHSIKTLRVDIGEEFVFHPLKALNKRVKFVKNFNAKSGTMIEVTTEGLLVSSKPSDDVFDGMKLRRKTSFHKKFYGDYIHLAKSELMKKISEDFGDQEVSFSGVVTKYNKKYKKQERILLITERAIYNIDPNGYIIHRHIPMRRLKAVTVSPYTDGFFVIHTPDEYDYVFESNKKTEILKVLSENYTNATRAKMKFFVKNSIKHRMKKGNENRLEFKEVTAIRGNHVTPTDYGAEIQVKVEEVMSNELDTNVVQDIYQGQKLRRKDSLLKWYLGDYLHIANTKAFEKIKKEFGDCQLLYSGLVQKINKRYLVQDRKLLVTDQAVYNLDNDLKVLRRIPFKEISGISVSTMRDGFFILKVPDEYDYLFSSPAKTEIIKAIMDQKKKVENRSLELQVDDKLVYTVHKGKGVKTLDFQDDFSVKSTLIIPTSTGALIKVNNVEVDEQQQNVPQEAEKNQLVSEVKQSIGADIYKGRKARKKASMMREHMGDYLPNYYNKLVQQLLQKNGDTQLLFASEVLKINKSLKTQKRIMIITDKHIYNIDPQEFKVKRIIDLDEIEGASMSPFADDNFCLHVPSSYDYLYDSDKKTEILDVLSNAIMKKAQKKLPINIADTFSFSPSGNDVVNINFVEDSNANETFIEPHNNNLVVRVNHKEPGVVLEAAYVYVTRHASEKDKENVKPIEVKSNPILIKLRKRWKYKLEIRFYVNEYLSQCSFHEKIDTVGSRLEFVSQVSDLEPREERYVITLPERDVVYSLLSKTRVKCKLVDPMGRTLLAVRFIYDVR